MISRMKLVEMGYLSEEERNLLEEIRNMELSEVEYSRIRSMPKAMHH